MRGIVIAQCGPLSLTSWGGGLSYTLRHEAERSSVFVQGDDATAFREELEAEEDARSHLSGLPEMWSRYGHVADPD
jgi:hypothetical protein